MKEYIWDFNTADGDTIKEKYETLMGLMTDCYAQHQITSIVASPEVMSILEVSIPKVDMEFVPLSAEDFVKEQKHNLYLCGRFKIGVVPIECYKSYSSNKYEMLLLGEENVTVKIVNFVI